MIRGSVDDEESAMNGDPRTVLASEPMGRLQIAAVAMCILLLAVDGFDVLAVSFAAPGIAAEWGIDRAALGLVLSMELIGMGVGSLFIGDVADRLGRRPMILCCLALMTAGMGLASLAGSVVALSAYRFVTGLGIGGVLASATAMVAEFSNDRHRSWAVALLVAGYPFGAVVGGSIVSLLLAAYDWRSVFVFGALLTGVFIPLVWYLLPESVSWLCEKRPKGALERVNHVLDRMGHAAVPALPVSPGPVAGSGLTELFRPRLARTTILLTLAYFAHIMTFYFIVKWIPKLVVDLGFEPALAGSVLVWFNVGGMAGCILFGTLTHYFGLRRMVIGVLLLAGAAVVVFGQGQANLAQLSLVAAVGGFFTNAAVVGLYALFAQSFPTAARAGGTGFAIGVGRGGAALGPVAAGLLFAAGGSLSSVALVMAVGSIAGAVALTLLVDARGD